MEADALGDKVVAIFEKLGCNIPTEHIEACQRISKITPQSLSRFHKGRAASSFGMSRDLQKIKMEDIDWPAVINGPTWRTSIRSQAKPKP